MKFKYFLIVLLALLMSCSKKTINFYSESTPAIDYTKYKTFAWHEATPSNKSSEDDKIIEWNVKNYVTAALKQRGMKIDVTNPDVLWDYEVDLESRIEQASVTVYSKYPHDYKDTMALKANKSIYRRSKRVGKELQTIPFEEAGLIVYMVDKTTQQLLWKGYMVEKVKDEYNFEKELEKDIHEIMKKYPLKPISK
ncbi:MAG: hypothetical protein RIQ70_74 [Bacteroidota bacterium]|jgi:hypothetical protein